VLFLKRCHAYTSRHPLYVAITALMILVGGALAVDREYPAGPVLALAIWGGVGLMAGLHVMLDKLLRQPRAATAEDIKSALLVEYSQIEALINVREDIAGIARLPPLRGWAASPDVLNILASRIASRLRKDPESEYVAIECGSGASTIFMASLFKRLGRGHVFSLDHDLNYAAETRRRLREAGLESYATVLDAPLSESVQAHGENIKWYSASVLPEGVQADLLFIDGPPAKGVYSRYPALGRLRAMLKPGAEVVLDDGARFSERTIVECWVAEHSVDNVIYHYCEKGAYSMTLRKMSGH
jgi:predicted O-methyltransferase YrrM